jgi:amidase
MAIEAPNAEQVLAIARSLGLELTIDDARSYIGFMQQMNASYERLDELPEPTPPVSYPRTPGYRPRPEENPYGAWYRKTDIRGAAGGPLAGKRVALKDNICLAGVPMMNGSRLLEGYVPDVDATVVTRILDAGGTIIGKAVCEDLCLSGASHTSQSGPVRNPRQPTHSSGGSSSGSAAVLAAGEADMALGGDQGGSIRIPASWCGVCGLKPTYGLVPYTGIFPVELTLDHCGPMAATVEDVALLLSVIAGPDGLDPRQGGAIPAIPDYPAALGGGAAGLRIALVREGFGRSESDPVVDERVRRAARRLEALGAAVAKVSVPLHAVGPHIHGVIIAEGATDLMIRGHGMGTNWDGYHPTGLLDAFARGWRARPHDLPETARLIVLMAEYMRHHYHGRYYAKAQNLRRSLRRAYDEVLERHDLLLMSTVPFRATTLPPPGCPREEYLARARDDIDANTCPFDVTGHPALSVPCGLADDLPIGMMLVGRRYEEATVLRAAKAFQDAADCRSD